MNMLVQTYRLACASAALSLLLVPDTAQARTNLDPVTTSITSAQQHLERFKASTSLDELHAAVLAMLSSSDIDALTPVNFIQKRREIVSEWAEILAAIEHRYGDLAPSSPNEVLFICAPPPPGYPSCAAPSTVSDPAERATYLSAISLNSAKMRKARDYQRLRMIDALAMLAMGKTLQVFRDDAPDTATPDFTALDAIIQRAGITQGRRSLLDAMFYPDPVAR